MADNVTLNAGSGGAVIATDDDTTAHHQYIKMEWGGDGTFTKVSTGASAVPIQDGGNTITVDGTVAVTGVSTAAKQPALGTAGTASTDVITVQGIAAMTPLLVNASGTAVPVTDNAGALTVDNGGTFAVQADSVIPGTGATNLGKAEDAAHTSGDVGVMLLGVRNDSASTSFSGTNGDYTPIATDSNGRLFINAISSIFSVTPGTSATALGKMEDAAHTTGDTGVFMLAVRDDSPAAVSGTDGDYEALHVNPEGGLWSTPTPSTQGGLSVAMNIDVDESEDAVKATAGQLYGWAMFNAASSTRYVKYYNDTVANVIVGTTVPILTIPLPAGAAANVEFSMGIPFSAAITIAATTGVATADTGAPGANEVIVNSFYK